MPPIKILHLSDIHFKADAKYTPKEKRLQVLNNLVSTLSINRSIFSNLSAIVISGDIAYSSDKKEYSEAKEFITKILDTFLDGKFDRSKIIICPGNHDVDRDLQKLVIKDSKFVDLSEELTLESKLVEDFHKRTFSRYIDFCEDLLGEGNGYRTFDENTGFTYGTRILKNEKVCFLILNSSWFCIGDKDVEGLFIGRKIVRMLISGIKKELDREFDDFLKITVIHHPPSWFHWKERFASENSVSSLSLINEFSDMVLCGHEHGELSSPVIYDYSCLWFKGGATHVKEKKGFYRNNCSLIEIDRDNFRVKRTGLKYDPISEQWVVSDPINYISGDGLARLNYLYEHGKDVFCNLAPEMAHFETAPTKDVKTSPVLTKSELATKLDPLMMISSIFLDGDFYSDEDNKELFLDKNSSKKILMINLGFLDLDAIDDKIVTQVDEILKEREIELTLFIRFCKKTMPDKFYYLKGVLYDKFLSFVLNRKLVLLKHNEPVF